MSRTMARPTPTSAAATAITNRAKIWPATVCRKAPKATRLMLTALRISSIDISTSTPLRRASTPYTPVQNRKAARNRNSFRYTAPSVPSRDDDGADQGGEEEHRHDLERD